MDKRRMREFPCPRDSEWDCLGDVPVFESVCDAGVGRSARTRKRRRASKTMLEYMSLAE